MSASPQSAKPFDPKDYVRFLPKPLPPPDPGVPTTTVVATSRRTASTPDQQALGFAAVLAIALIVIFVIGHWLSSFTFLNVFQPDVSTDTNQQVQVVESQPVQEPVVVRQQAPATDQSSTVAYVDDCTVRSGSVLQNRC